MRVLRQPITTSASQSAYFTAYLQDVQAAIEPKRLRPAIVLCPGGSYRFVSPREGEPVALAFLAAGYQVFVVQYSVGSQNPFPTALLELAAVVTAVRNHADEWAVDKTAIIGLGFSAGGHLVASLGTLADTPVLAGYPDAHLDGMILGYPVITSGTDAHQESLANLLGEYPTPEALAQVSLERQVSQKTPPTFLWATFTDQTVPVANTLLFASALQAHGVSCELHVFPTGRHGLSLGTRQTWNQPKNYGLEPAVAVWLDLCLTWLRRFEQLPVPVVGRS